MQSSDLLLVSWRVMPNTLSAIQKLAAQVPCPHVHLRQTIFPPTEEFTEAILVLDLDTWDESEYPALIARISNLREQQPDLSIVALATNPEIETAVDVLKAGALDILNKRKAWCHRLHHLMQEYVQQREKEASNRQQARWLKSENYRAILGGAALLAWGILVWWF